MALPLSSNRNILNTYALNGSKEFEDDATYITELSTDLQTECSKFGLVKKILIFDRHPEGVVSVRFADLESAERCIEVMNGRFFAKRRLLAEHWDGATDYKVCNTNQC